jgi:hypothetical protein
MFPLFFLWHTDPLILLGRSITLDPSMFAFAVWVVGPFIGWMSAWSTLHIAIPGLALVASKEKSPSLLSNILLLSSCSC